MLSRALRAAVVIAAFAGLLLVASCGSAREPFPVPSAVSGNDVTPSGGGAGSGTTPSQQPTPSDSNRNATLVATRISGSCHLLDSGSEIDVNYSARASGGLLTRVRFLVDGSVAEDSGQISQSEYNRTATLKVPDGSSHTFQVIAESGAAHSTVSTIVRCQPPPANGQRS